MHTLKVHTIFRDLPVALPPDTEKMMTVSADRRTVGGLMLTTTGTAIPSVASPPIRETGPKLNWNVCAAGN